MESSYFLKQQLHNAERLRGSKADLFWDAFHEKSDAWSTGYRCQKDAWGDGSDWVQLQIYDSISSAEEESTFQGNRTSFPE